MKKKKKDNSYFFIWNNRVLCKCPCKCHKKEPRDVPSPFLSHWLQFLEGETTKVSHVLCPRGCVMNGEDGKEDLRSQNADSQVHTVSGCQSTVSHLDCWRHEPENTTISNDTSEPQIPWDSSWSNMVHTKTFKIRNGLNILDTINIYADKKNK
jgi:hypothetical protein